MPIGPISSTGIGSAGTGPDPSITTTPSTPPDTLGAGTGSSLLEISSSLFGDYSFLPIESSSFKLSNTASFRKIRVTNHNVFPNGNPLIVEGNSGSFIFPKQRLLYLNDSYQSIIDTELSEFAPGNPPFSPPQFRLRKTKVNEPGPLGIIPYNISFPGQEAGAFYGDLTTINLSYAVSGAVDTAFRDPEFLITPSPSSFGKTVYLVGEYPLLYADCFSYVDESGEEFVDDLEFEWSIDGKIVGNQRGFILYEQDPTGRAIPGSGIKRRDLNRYSNTVIRVDLLVKNKAGESSTNIDILIWGGGVDGERIDPNIPIGTTFQSQFGYYVNWVNGKLIETVTDPTLYYVGRSDRKLGYIGPPTFELPRESSYDGLFVIDSLGDKWVWTSPRFRGSTWKWILE